jgi:hypothetical protein
MHACAFFLLVVKSLMVIQMKILVVADNHGDDQILRNIQIRHQDCDVYLHAGDSKMHESALAPFITVRGNNDFLIENYFRIINTPLGKIYLTHGHKELASSSLITTAKQFGCKFVIHGHTHKSAYYEKDGILVLCPGALSYPRGGEDRRYAIIELNEETKTINVKFIDFCEFTY